MKRGPVFLAAVFLLAAALAAPGSPGKEDAGEGAPSSYRPSGNDGAAAQPAGDDGGAKRLHSAVDRLPGPQRAVVVDAFAEFGRSHDGRALARILSGGLSAADAQAILQSVQSREGSIPSSFWDEAARRYPDTPFFQSRLGQAAGDAGDYQTSAEAYDKAIREGDSTPENFYGRGLAADRLGDAEQAHHDAGVALSMDPGSPTAKALYKLTEHRHSRVRLNLNSGGMDAADPEEAEGDGAVAAGEGPAAREPTAAAQVAARAPQVGASRLSSGWTKEAQRFLKVGDYAGAAAAATKAIGLDPGNVHAYNLRAAARDKAGDHESAAADATKALVLAPGNVPVLNTRARAYNGMKRFALALADSDALLAASPANGFGWANRARAQGGLGRRAEMVESLRRAAEADPRFKETLDAAMRLPGDQDTELLFQGGVEPGAPAPVPAGADRRRRFLLLMLSSLAGGLLVALGLLHVLFPELSRRAATTLRRPRRGLAAPPGEVFDPSPEGTSPFWRRHEYRRVIASGGMGIVYEAVDKGLGRRVAVKKMRGEIRDDPAERERFLREARLVAGVEHPNIVRIYAVVEEGPDVYLVFEYVDGPTLSELLKRRGRLPFPEAATLLRGACAALQFAHDHAVIHRDLKPSNIMVAKDGEAKVMDFGVARQAKEALAKLAVTNTVCGTPPYMAPEAERGVVCGESDVFALGVCLYELVTGERPFEGNPGTMLLNKMSGAFEPASRRVPGLPPGFDGVVAKALAPAPSARFRRPDEFWTALRALAG